MSKRSFNKSSILGFSGALIIPHLFPVHVSGKNRKNSETQTGQIAFGRITSSFDSPKTIKNTDLNPVQAIGNLVLKKIEQAKVWV